MGNWFPKKGRGLIFGLWTCHQYVGDIVSGLATAGIVAAGFAWQWALLVPAILNGVWGIVNFLYLPNKPREVGIETEEDKKAASSGGSTGGGREPPSPPPLWAWRSPTSSPPRWARRRRGGACDRRPASGVAPSVVRRG